MKDAIRRSSLVAIATAMLMFAAGCIADQGLDKAKFAELNRAAQDLKAALGSGERCEVPDAVVQRLAAGVEAVKNRTASQPERDLLAAYGELVAISRDGALLCRSRSQLSAFQILPKGRIYVSQELDPLAEKYGLPVERHLYKPTGAYIKSIPGDSITVIWKHVEDRIKKIEIMMKYN